MNKETVDGRINERAQYEEQVFRQGHNLPTMSIEDLAQMEMEDALER